MRWSRGLLPALALTAACTHTTQNGMYATQTRLLIADDPGGAAPLAESRPLRPGQIFALVLDLDQPAHAYVIERRGGVLVNIYPGDGLRDVELGRGTVRLPGPDAWMRVPQLDHQSRLCVLLGARPIEPDLRHCPTGRKPRPGSNLIQAFVLPQAR